MGPHNVNRPQSRTITFTDDTLVQPHPNATAQARDAFNRTFGNPTALTVQNPFTGITQAPTAPQRPTELTQQFGPLGTGQGANPHDRPVRSSDNPIPTLSFANRDDLLARARTAGHLPGDGFHAPRPSLNGLARNGGHHRPVHGHATATAGRNPQHLPPRPTTPTANPSQPRIQPSLNMRHVGTTVEYTPNGTRRHTTIADVYRSSERAPTERPPQRIQHASANTERRAQIQGDIASLRAELAMARNDLASGGNHLFRADDRQHYLDQAQTRFERVQTSLHALQQNQNLTREERIEISRFSRSADFRNMSRDLSDARMNLGLDTI